MKKIYLETFGCQMNVLDSELVECQLRALGYAFTPRIEQADVVLYNTCSVREKSEQKVWSRLGLLRERKAADPSLVVGVIGCMAERDGAGLMKRMPQVDLMCGPSELDQLPSLLDNVLRTGKQQHALAGNTSRRSKALEHASESEDGLEMLDLSRSFSPQGEGRRARYQAYIRIVRGCNKFCTYCVVPYTRGAEVSRTPHAILEEARKLVDAGCLEITLLGQTVNHYVHEAESSTSTSTGPAKHRTTFADLLHLLHTKLPALPRLRFLTSFPADFGDDILHVMAASPRICRYLHIPAQSGSNRILKAMNRGYTAESYLELVERARRIVPEVQLAGDFIVGFPTETDDDYAATRRLLEQVRYKNAFIFKYSPRPGTIAIKRFADDVPEEIKRFRNNDLLRAQNDVCRTWNETLLGRTVEVLCEGPSGWTNSGEGGEPESVVAGKKESAPEASCASHHHAPAGSVELGARLAAGLRKSQPAAARAKTSVASIAAPPTFAETADRRTDRHGRPYRVPASGATRPGWVQLTGRTTFDQIVVFQGPADASGRLLNVTVREAHGMTIFGDWVEAAGGPSAALQSASRQLAHFP